MDYNLLEDLTSSEIFMGLIIYTKKKRFDIEEFYEIFRRLGRDNIRFDNRPLDKMLSFFQMSYAIFQQPHMLHTEIYEINQSDKSTIEKVLKDDKILPKNKKALQQIAKEFDSLKIKN